MQRIGNDKENNTVMENGNPSSGGKNNAFKAGMWYVVSSVAVKAIAIITTPIFTRLLSTEEYGIVSTFTSWYSLLLTFCTLNLTYSIGRAKLDYSDKLDDYIGSMQILSALVTLIWVIVAVIFIKPLSSILGIGQAGVILLALYLFFTPAINFYQNGARYRYHYKENIGIAWYTAVTTVVLSLALILLLDGDKALYRMIGIVVPTVVLSSILWVRAFRRGSLHVNKDYWKYGISISAPLILHTVSLNILSQSDRIFITNICGASDTGIYSLVYSYGLLLTIITNAVSDGWLPWFHDTYFEGKFEEIRKNVKWIVLLGWYLAMACIALAPEAVSILGGEKYSSGVACVPPIVLGVFCQYVYTHYVNIELHLKKTKFVSYGTICAAVLNIVLNAIFIPMFGYVAAAYTTLFSYIVLMFVHYFISSKILKVKLYNNAFMFGTVFVAGLVSMILIISYSYTWLRYTMIIIGFISFVFVFRNFIIGYLKK
ncbi:MAG: oligosaccharide flippase family protein [Bacteroides thetaiotaomicron]|nr:oligosaccharide flippase family protein [Bacteroides thetaiotaomicron]